MNFFTRYLMKKAARAADDGIMITLPSADKIKFQEQMLIDLLMRNGIDPNAIKSEQMLDNVLNQIEAVEKQNLANNIRAEARKAEKSGIRTIESGKVFDMEGKEIPRGSKIMGGKEVPGTSDRDRVRNEMKTKYGFTDERLDEIENINLREKLIKEKIENQNKQSLEKMKEKSKKKQDRMDDIFGDFDGLDDFASGGRVGLKAGVGKKGLQELAKKFGLKFASDLEQPPKSKLRNMFKDFESRNPIEKEMDVVELNKPKNADIGSLEEFYNDFVKAGGNPDIDQMKLMQAYRLKKAYPFNTPYIDKNGKVIGGEATQKMYPESPKFIIEDRDKLMEQINDMREGKMPRTPEGERTGLDVPPVPEGFKLSKEKLMKKFPEIDEDYADEIMDMDKDLQGRIIKMLENRRLDPKAYDELLEKYGDTLEFQKEFDKVTRRKNNASGGIARLGFKAGGIDKARRAFLKVLGAGVAGIGAVKTGLLKLGGKQAVKEVVKTAPAPGKPEWFDSLVNKVITQGQDVTKDVATLDRTIVHRYKLDTDETVDVTQYLDSGDIKVTYDSPNNMAGEYVDLNYKAPEMLEEGKVVPADFKAIETEPRGVRSGPDDYDIEFDGENIVENVDELMSDVNKLKSLGGKNPSMREILEGTKKKKKVQAINEDNVEQAEYLETKYGPGGDYASGGIARMLGE